MIRDHGGEEQIDAGAKAEDVGGNVPGLAPSARTWPLKIHMIFSLLPTSPTQNTNAVNYNFFRKRSFPDYYRSSLSSSILLLPNVTMSTTNVNGSGGSITRRGSFSGFGKGIEGNDLISAMNHQVCLKNHGASGNSTQLRCKQQERSQSVPAVVPAITARPNNCALPLPLPAHLRADGNPYINLWGHESKRIIKYKSQLAMYSGVVSRSKVPNGQQPKRLTNIKSGCCITCRRCLSRFRKPSQAQEHFPSCIKINGNPLGLRFDSWYEDLRFRQSKKQRISMGNGKARKLR